MGSDRWREYGTWHELFDAVCNHAGHYDNTDLASLLCTRTGRTRQNDFEGAKTKLRSWRSGKRVPRRKSFFALSSILDVRSDPELEARWHALYEAANGKGDAPSGGDEALDSRAVQAGIAASRLRVVAAVSAVSVLGVGIAIAAITRKHQPPSPELPAVNYNAHVRVALGRSQLIHGDYLDCDGSVPDWPLVAQRVPITPLGTFSDGGLARKMVNDCGREMVVRAVMFTGTALGTEEVRLLDDYMKIEVVDTTTGL
ncbi:hypothetical protein [Neoaquamicrobium sediminum]|uniref:hypothetical protein n=1 Tax=Neoaquamicrobium sediminum TaxID=1849104 RepID=UPI0015677B07|nr:hypothetical protein [Mesorhizobium sediminum]NRC55407.1 hypothetical protein [Mesorhizobium sediminum]